MTRRIFARPLRLAALLVAAALAAGCGGVEDGTRCDDGGSGGRVVHGVCL